MWKNHLLIVLFFIMTLASGQQRDYIFGQLVDATQNEPIPFATIRVKDKALGVISNFDGTFKIPLRYKTLGDILSISCMGFESKEIPVQDLKEEESNIIILKPGTFELTEAVVSANIKELSAKQIVKIAVNSIPQNFPDNNFRLVGYYRDYQIKNKEYTNLNEAIIQFLDYGFGRKNNLYNQYKIYSYSKNPDFEIDSFAKQPYDYRKFNKVVPNAKMENDGGNEFITLIIHDAIRNYGIESFSFVDNLASDFVENHRFKLINESNYNKESIYEIELSFRNSDYLAKGKIFINTDDFAIHKLDYTVFKRKKPGDYSIAVNASERYSDGFEDMANEILYRINTEYIRGPSEKMILNYISFYNKVMLQRPAEFKSKFVIDLEDKSFKIRVNKIPADLDNIKTRDFKISYKNDFVPIKEFWFREDERTFVVCPHVGYERAEHLFKGLFLEREDLQVSDVKYGYGDIKDSLGNKLDERKWEYIHQYREFFTQEAKIGENMVEDMNNLMLKNLPLDSPEQPISALEMKNEYWMNTPLPTFKN
ncbi:carboxypeptidase-like regulatory domain-containing protein [Maribacter aestuarii]|uniref:carboxypeptidase-like regulatory domain-containing protein n=1 Tax=Maribacter aestuarii TaxID=1130723 RepID=UPI00248C23A3|nr:carboxypeptidase-like regulatory domain-containing protein [Maribacter aestuarii]